MPNLPRLSARPRTLGLGAMKLPGRNSGPDWDTALAAFLDNRRAENVTPATLRMYGWTLDGERSRAFRVAHRIKTTRDFTAEMLGTLVRECLADGKTAVTAGNYLRYHQGFLRFCAERGWYSDERALNMKGPRKPKRSVQTLSEEEEEQLLAATTSPRDRMLIRLALETGLRKSELANLTIDDIWEPSKGRYRLRVRQGKGRKDREVPLAPQFVTELQEYIREHRPDSASRAMFLTSQRKTAGDYGPLGSTGVYLIFKRLRLGTGMRVYPHKMRHTFATRAASKGLSAAALQKALGHSSYQMSAHYIANSGVDLDEGFERMRRADLVADSAPLIAQFANARERKEMLAFAEGIVRSLHDQGRLPAEHPFNALFKPRLEDVDVVRIPGTWSPPRRRAGAVRRTRQGQAVATESRA